eukprot:762510-Hanusia_phi.AAC.10
MSPTRIPYEESSVFSIKKFRKATDVPGGMEVVLRPGEVRLELIKPPVLTSFFPPTSVSSAAASHLSSPSPVLTTPLLSSPRSVLSSPFPSPSLPLAWLPASNEERNLLQVLYVPRYWWHQVEVIRALLSLFPCFTPRRRPYQTASQSTRGEPGDNPSSS